MRFLKDYVPDSTVFRKGGNVPMVVIHRRGAYFLCRWAAYPKDGEKYFHRDDLFQFGKQSMEIEPGCLARRRGTKLKMKVILRNGDYFLCRWLNYPNHEEKYFHRDDLIRARANHHASNRHWRGPKGIGMGGF